MLRAATVRSYDRFTRSAGRRMAEALLHKLAGSPKACWLFCAPLEGIEE